MDGLAALQGHCVARNFTTTDNGTANTIGEKTSVDVPSGDFSFGRAPISSVVKLGVASIQFIYFQFYNTCTTNKYRTCIHSYTHTEHIF